MKQKTDLNFGTKEKNLFDGESQGTQIKSEELFKNVTSDHSTSKYQINF